MGDGSHTNPFHVFSRAASFVTKPIVKMGEAVFGPELFHSDEPGSGNHSQDDEEDDEDRMSLEGSLYFRKGKAQGGSGWKRRLIMLDFEHGGTLSCYKVTKDEPAKVIRNMYSKLHRHLSVGRNLGMLEVDKNLRIFLPADVPWVAKDVEHDPSTFVVEVPTDKPIWLKSLLYAETEQRTSSRVGSNVGSPTADPDDDDDDISLFGDDEFSTVTAASKSDISTGFHKARSRSKPLRFYFKCPRKGNEKALWMRAFAKVGRLSTETRKRRRLFGGLGQIKVGANSRIRNDAGAQFARETRQLDIAMSTKITNRNTSVFFLHKDIEDITKRVHNHERREFRVTPTYCYPHMWMTVSELREECNLPSKEFHDLRLPHRKGEEIGTLRVEVLQCMGLPKLDRAGHADGVVYLVCGSYAFATDVIPDNANPMWLRKTRRACIFPIFHGYARLYVGVFDDDGIKEKDDLAGRVVIDLCRLRPGCRYDVTLPLRMSAHVYSRRQRGAIRLRFQLDWKSEKKALMSYIPKKVKFRNVKPNYNETIMCTDATSFRNVVLTVHGTHLPGKFSFNQFRATIKEINFTRKMVMTTIKGNIRDVVRWRNPALSAFVFLAWMHCIYANSFALVPAYFVTFVMLLMMRNYARYGIDGPSQRGVVPPTWEELFTVLISRHSPHASYSIEEIELRSKQATLSPSSFSETSSTEDSVPAYTVTTHVPKGKHLFRWLGFLESEEVLENMSPDHRHLEFPFAPGEYYPKFTVKEGIVVGKKGKDPAAEEPKAKIDSSEHFVVESARGDMVEPSLHLQALVDANDDLTEMGDPHQDSNISNQDESRTGDGDISQNFSEHGSGPVGTTVQFESQPTPSVPQNIVTMQNIDSTIEGKGTKLTDDLAEIKEKLHELTGHLFNDRTHLPPNPEGTAFSNPRKSSSRKKDTTKELEKVLNIGSYSHSNPVISRVGLYLTPVVDGALSFLCLFRALFNVFTWRDPYLSFLVSIAGSVLALILFVFPWRIFLFIAGMVVVGPQVSMDEVHCESVPLGSCLTKQP